MAFDIFSSSESKQDTKQQQVGVQTGQGSALVYGGISGAKGNIAAQGSQQQIIRGVKGNVTVESTDPMAFEAVKQSNLVVGEIANTGISLANQTSIRALETLQLVSERQSELAGEAVDTSQEIAEKATPDEDQSDTIFWIIGTVVLLAVAGYFAFVHKK